MTLVHLFDLADEGGFRQRTADRSSTVQTSDKTGALADNPLPVGLAVRRADGQSDGIARKRHLGVRVPGEQG